MGQARSLEEAEKYTAQVPSMIVFSEINVVNFRTSLIFFKKQFLEVHRRRADERRKDPPRYVGRHGMPQRVLGRVRPMHAVLKIFILL